MKKVSFVQASTRKQVFLVEIEDRNHIEFPFELCDPTPSRLDPIENLCVDLEVGSLGFTYTLESGAVGSVLSDHLLWYSREPDAVVERLLYRLSLEASRLAEAPECGLRALSRRLETSPTQIYRLLDPTFYGKSVDQMVRLLTALGAEIRLDVVEIAACPPSNTSLPL